MTVVEHMNGSLSVLVNQNYSILPLLITIITLQKIQQQLIEAYHEPSAGVGGGFGGARRRRSGAAAEPWGPVAAVSEGAAPGG